MAELVADDRPTFIVGTGRCGSTVLSRILNAHSDVLSLNELLTTLGTRAMPEADLTGAEFWRIIADPNPVFDAMARHGTPLPELLYPKSQGRFAPETTGVPAMSLAVLPHLSDDPDGLYDELSDEVPHWPRRHTAAQYRALFDWLCARFERRVVAERSGYSLHRIPRLHELFPDAKFVHLLRDGPDCALSMSKHPGLRIILLRHQIMDLLGKPFDEVTTEDVDSLPPMLAGIFPDRFDAEAVWQPIPLAAFGELWSRLIEDGLRHLAEVPGRATMSIVYDDILDDADAELSRLAVFLDVDPTESWLGTARSLLDPSRRGASRLLPPEEFEQLRSACEPGSRALRQVAAG